MDEQQLANRSQDPVAQAEEAPVDPTPEPQPNPEPETPVEPTSSIEDNSVSEPVPAPETPAISEEAQLPVDQVEVFKTEYEALIAKTGYCLQVTPKFFKDESTGIFNTSKFTLEVTVAESK